MPEWVTKVVVALIGLIGTLIAAYFGYRQWRLSRNDSAHQDVAKAKRQTYADLWKLVENTHVDLRRNPDAIQHLPERIADVNAYILENELYLTDGDYDLVNDYLKALGEMVSWARQQDDPATGASLESTAAFRTDANIVGRAFDLRDQLLRRVRKALDES